MRIIVPNSLSIKRKATVVGATLSLLLTLFWVWSEVVAETVIREPASDGTVMATPTGCGSSGNYDCLNDGVFSPDNPATGSDFLQFSIDHQMDFYQLAPLDDVETVTSITFYLYHTNTGNTNMEFQIGLYESDEETVIASNQAIPQRTSAQWDTVTFSGLSLDQDELDDLHVRLSCTRTTGGQPGGCRAFALYAEITYDPIVNVTVDSIGTQQDVDAGSINQYLGGAFTFIENVDSSNITSITISESGTIHAGNDLDNVRLYYALDTTTPYDCSNVSYTGNESMFGATTTFNGANGTATFTDNVSITTTQSMCVYVVVDIKNSAQAGDTINLSINDPPNDIAFSTSFLEPDESVTINGVSTVRRVDLTQFGYHWRNDDGDEETATSVTGGNENTSFDAAPRETTLRLRLGVSNQGNKTSDASAFRLEYGQRVTSCQAISNWQTVGSSGALWEMSPTSNLTDGDNTTDIPVADGGLSNPTGGNFLTSNGGIRDTNFQTGNLTLAENDFVELEYAIEATQDAGDGITYCFRVTASGTALDTYEHYAEATTFSDLTVSTLGTQISTVEIPSQNVYAGGAFVITDQTIGAHEISSITISATGTADIANDIENLRLYYDLDTTSPYDCTSESYQSNDTQFGGTQSGGFSSIGTATFSGSVSVDPEQSLCLYIVYDIASTTADGGSISFRINDPSTDIVIDQGDIGPAALVEIAGDTTFVTDETAQVHYHWRNNDGSEAEATSATFGQHDTPLDQLRIDSPIRLRLAISNQGGQTTPARNYRLESARRVTTCSMATGWSDVGISGGAWNMSPSANLTDGDDTTNIALNIGGVPDPQPNFLSINGGVRDTNSETGSITLQGYTFVELEYSIVATDEAIEGAEYCFRVTDSGSPLDTYLTYPRVTIKEPTDYLIQRGWLNISGTSASITAGVDYEAPNSADRAFIRITNTLNTGAGGGTSGPADDVTVYISNPGNITNGITFTRPATAGGTTRVAWEIIEYTGAPGGQNELIVRQHGTATYGSAATTATTGTVSGVVNDEQVVVFITGQLNPDTGTNYQRGNSTAFWNSSNDTATFTRGESGNASILSYAVVEFAGMNWQIQRAEHNYTSAGSTETESIDPVNSLSRAFLHTQKRMGAGQNTHGDFGHQVWLSGLGQISFLLDSTATTPSSHHSVVWVIENTQTAGEHMIVTRSNGTQSGGTAPLSLAVNIGKTLDDLEIASIFMNNSGDEPGFGSGQNNFPDPLMSARIISPTQYELWIADTRGSRSWRTEVVEWPTAARTFTQNYYRFYVNNEALTPTKPWPEDGPDVAENSPITLADIPVGMGQSLRIRMTVAIDAAGKVPGVDAFTLQYGERLTSCNAITEWHDLGENNDENALWRGRINTPDSGTPLSDNPPEIGDLLISVSDVAGTYEDGPTSAFTPFPANPGDDVEFDWSIEHNGAKDETIYCFRMIESNGLEFIAYNHYPTLLTAGYVPVLSRWRWYEDHQNVTPDTPLAEENTAPIDIQFPEIYKLRVSVAEVAGATGFNAKFALQYSEYSDFSQTVNTLTATSSCEDNSLWCYAEGGGVDNQAIDTVVISDSDNCVSGVGAGCGTQNESISTTTATLNHEAFSTAEFEFTLKHAGARANAVYYFRLYDLQNDKPVIASTTLPSLVTQGSELVFNVEGVPAKTVIQTITTNATSTPTRLIFNDIPLNQPYYVAHRLTIDTNATEGYQVLMFADQHPTNDYGTIIEPITGSNLEPVGWNTGCLLSAQSCFGYRTTDDILSGGSTRFAPSDSWSALSFTPKEVMYNPTPTIDTYDIVYAIQVSAMQEAGNYQNTINYIAVPVF